MTKTHSKTSTTFSLAVTAVLLWAFLVSGSIGSEYETIKTLSASKTIGSATTWQIIASQEDAGKNYPQLPAKICFLNTPSMAQQCELAVGVEVIDLEAVRFRNRGEPSSGVLFWTNTYAMGGGPLYVSLWVYDRDVKRFRNILPAGMYVRALGTHKFFPSLQNKSVLIVAGPSRLVDFNAPLDDPDRETIWSPHYYIVDIYRYHPNLGFTKIGSYETKKKYDPEEDHNTLIDSELPRIRALLRKQ